MDKIYADMLIAATTEMYDSIATDFSQKRALITPDILDLGKYAKPGDFVADIGCGSGRLSELFPAESYTYVGLDLAPRFLEEAHRRYPDRDFVPMDGLDIPLPDGSVDITYSLAMLHHVPSDAYRMHMVQEIRRITKRGGTAVCTVWNLRDNPKARPLLDSSPGNPSLDPGDMFLPYTDSGHGLTVERYLHAFTPEELLNLFREAGFDSVELLVQKRGTRVVNQNFCCVAC